MRIVLSGPIKGVCKSYGLWVEDSVSCVPLVFLRKPKWVANDEAWVKFLRGAFTMINAEGQAALNEMLEVRND